ncbi:MAG TPA: DegQ family serine endoprotease [Pyrinomonadaceae bacterium]|nr:DegQ family serine endoprotease [Pyrinomonadaceae bacterium]
MSTRRIYLKGKGSAASVKQQLRQVALIISLAVFAAQGVAAQALSATGVPAAGPGGSGAVVTSYADMVSRVAPAVVTIHSEMRVPSRQGEIPFPFPFPFGDDTPGTPQRERRASGLGSGVIVTADGYILTNHHVVDGALEINVELTDNRSFDARVVGSDKASDLAVLKVNASNLPVLPLGDSDRVRVGDVVLAIGNPLGLGQTVTSGIISAKGRSTGAGDSFEDFLQTDAAINRGNSGGALINTGGELVGINSQILSPTGGSIGIGFAIPSNMARSVMEQLIKTGRVRRSKIGVRIQPVTADIASSLGLAQARGAIVTAVEPGSPAERAGIRRGDVITAFNGGPVTDTNSLRNQVARTQPGTEATVSILRDNREQQLRVTVTELLAEKTDAGEAEADGNAARGGGKLGVTVEPLTPALAARLELPEGAKGVVVTGVDPNGPAADAGIRQGDVIEEVNRQPVRSAADLNAALQGQTARPLLLLINRQGQPAYITVRPRQ